MSQANNLQTKRGSIMIAALVITLVTAGLIGMFLKTVLQEVENSHRFSMGFHAINLAEAGLDYAIDALIHDNWDGWESGSNGYLIKKDFSAKVPSNSLTNSTGALRHEGRHVRVFIDPNRQVNGKTIPAIVAQATVSLPSGVEVRRQIYIELGRGINSNGFWGNGILGKEGVVLGGTKQRVDSFTSHPYNPDDPDNQKNIDDQNRYKNMTVEEIYADQVGITRLGHTLANPNGSVASLSIVIDDISVQNADVYGRISTGADKEGVDLKKFIGPQGSLYDNEAAFESEKDDVDLGNIAYDFKAELPPVAAPTDPSAITSISGGVLGADGSKTFYELDSLTLRNNDALSVKGEVTLVVKGDIDVGGVVDLGEDAKLRVFVKGDVTVGGNGIVNSNSPRNLIIYNTTSPTDIANGADRPEVKLHGNGFLSAAVYAPEADISLKGGGGSGEMFGSVVGNTVTFAGNNYNFHYDESLAFINDDDGGAKLPQVTKWLELTDASDRYDMDSILNNGF